MSARLFRYLILLVVSSSAFAQTLGEGDVFAKMKICYEKILATTDPMDVADVGGECRDPGLGTRKIPNVLVLPGSLGGKKGIFVMPYGGGEAAFQPLEPNSAEEKILEYQFHIQIAGQVIDLRYDQNAKTFHGLMPMTDIYASGCNFEKIDHPVDAKTISDFGIQGTEVTQAFATELKRRVDFAVNNYNGSVGPDGRTIPFKAPKTIQAKGKDMVQACQAALQPVFGADAPELNDLRISLNNADDAFKGDPKGMPKGSTSTDGKAASDNANQ
jgi:hypothetical protein